MIDFTRYILQEFKNKRLLRSEAVELLRQYNEKNENEERSIIHPLLHRNTSDFSEQRFSSVFSGEEFFLKDHAVRGERVLPGAAILEMAGEAVKISDGLRGEEGKVICIRDIEWIRPFILKEKNREIHLALFPEDCGEVYYELYSDSEGHDEEAVVFSRGRVRATAVGETPRLDIESLKNLCCEETFNGEECYESFRSLGIEYGQTHRCVKEIHAGTGCILSKLVMPSFMKNTEGLFTLHPAMMDSGLHSSIGLMMRDKKRTPLKLSLPYALEEMEIYGRTQASMWAYTRYSEGSRKEDKSRRLDIDLCDDDGKVLVRMKGFTSMEVERKLGEKKSQEEIGTLILRTEWKEESAGSKGELPEYAEHLVILIGQKDIAEKIETKVKGSRCLDYSLDEKEIDKRFEIVSVRVFEEIQRILRSKPKGKVLIQIVISIEKEGVVNSALAGILKTANLENPKIKWQMIEMEEESAETVAERLNEEIGSGENVRIRYKNGKRLAERWIENVTGGIENIPWKDNGVYLITGGAGGLGLIFAEEIAERVEGAALILSGRSPLEDGKRGRIKRLEEMGARVEYVQLDVTHKNDVEDAIKIVEKKYGHLNGIIHSAGIIKDNFIIKKSREEFLGVLSPKVTGLVNLDAASKNVDLDFFVLFSSGAGAVGNLGQADYSCANAFMDAFSGYRNTLVESQERHGKTLSINWPLWKEGGMRMDEAAEKMMFHNYGMIPMRTETGIKSLYIGLNADADRIMVAEGLVPRIRGSIIEQASIDNTNDDLTSGKNKSLYKSETGNMLQENALNYFTKEISTVLKLPANRIDPAAPLEKYGIDSILVMKLTAHLEKTFGSLPKTLFFEYQNIMELTKYFVDSYKEKLKNILEISEETESNNKSKEDVYSPTENIDSFVGRRKFSRYKNTNIILRESNARDSSDIAIIGLSGRYPMANDVYEFWENLKAGKDCITEIPEERWDKSLYFDEEKDKPGKSYSKWGGFIDDVDKFDPLFFNISPREAEVMDPQERLFLETVWKTIEDAGYSKTSLEGENIGVFVGCMYRQYGLTSNDLEIISSSLTNSYWSIANRVSYFFNFSGPSFSIDAACASSLTAIHMACESIRRGECRSAIAGGVNLSLDPLKYVGLSRNMLISSGNKSKSLGNGDGYVPGEGVGCVLLKTFSQAVKDGDHVYGLIKGSSINHSGKSNTYTTPNLKRQADLIEETFNKTGVNPRSISYVECAANGSELGDAIEFAGLTKAFKKFTSDSNFCSIGSVKSNIGHLEGASGISQLTKVLLQMKYKMLAPTINAHPVNSNINLEDSPFYIQNDFKEWQNARLENNTTTEYPRLSLISSFGAGGTNVNMIIEEYIQPHREYSEQGKKPYLFLFSAKTRNRLKEVTRRTLDFLENHEGVFLPDIAYTLQVGREAMDERLAMIVNSVKELKDKLINYCQIEKYQDGIYQGNINEDQSKVNLILEGKIGEEILKIIINNYDVVKLAQLWVSGAKIDWNQLYSSKSSITAPQRVSLPTYLFERKRYWIPSHKEIKDYKKDDGIEITPESVINRRNELNPINDEVQNQSIDGKVILLLKNIISQNLKLDEEEINENRNLHEYGFDSIAGMKMINYLQEILDKKIPISSLFKNDTIADFSRFLINEDFINEGFINLLYTKNKIVIEEQKKQSTPEITKSEFDEVDLFNEKHYRNILEKVFNGEIEWEKALDIVMEEQKEQSIPEITKSEFDEADSFNEKHYRNILEKVFNGEIEWEKALDTV